MSPSLLFVSHDADLRAVASRVLSRAGFAVTAVAHGGHALLACVEHGRFDVLVVEDEMPEGPGREIVGWLLKQCPAQYVVRMCEAAPTPGGVGVTVVRPFMADDLIEAVQT